MTTTALTHSMTEDGMDAIDAALEGAEVQGPSLRARKSWRGWEARFLRKWYGIASMARIAQVLRRSPGSVEGKAHALGLHGAPNLGQYSAVPIELRFWQYVKKGEGCWEWQGALHTKGYGLTSIGGRTVNAHRVAWQLANGPIPRGLYVCHHCDNPPCVRPDHLFLGTNQDNQLDASRKGRLATGSRNGIHKNTLRGELSGNAKLTTELVLAIRASVGPHEPIARRFGISISQTGRIRRRESWRHV